MAGAEADACGFRAVCDHCDNALAHVFCHSDGAFLCPTCDAEVHSVNKLAQRHLRVPCQSCPVWAYREAKARGRLLDLVGLPMATAPGAQPDTAAAPAAATAALTPNVQMDIFDGGASAWPPPAAAAQPADAGGGAANMDIPGGGGGGGHAPAAGPTAASTPDTETSSPPGVPPQCAYDSPVSGCASQFGGSGSNPLQHAASLPWGRSAPPFPDGQGLCDAVSEAGGGGVLSACKDDLFHSSGSSRLKGGAASCPPTLAMAQHHQVQEQQLQQLQLIQQQLAQHHQQMAHHQQQQQQQLAMQAQQQQQQQQQAEERKAQEAAFESVDIAMMLDTFGAPPLEQQQQQQQPVGQPRPARSMSGLLPALPAATAEPSGPMASQLQQQLQAQHGRSGSDQSQGFDGRMLGAGAALVRSGSVNANTYNSASAAAAAAAVAAAQGVDFSGRFTPFSVAAPVHAAPHTQQQQQQQQQLAFPMQIGPAMVMQQQPQPAVPPQQQHAPQPQPGTARTLPISINGLGGRDYFCSGRVSSSGLAEGMMGIGLGGNMSDPGLGMNSLVSAGAGASAAWPQLPQHPQPGFASCGVQQAMAMDIPGAAASPAMGASASFSPGGSNAHALAHSHSLGHSLSSASNSAMGLGAGAGGDPTQQAHWVAAAAARSTSLPYTLALPCSSAPPGGAVNTSTSLAAAAASPPFSPLSGGGGGGPASSSMSMPLPHPHGGLARSYSGSMPDTFLLLGMPMGPSFGSSSSHHAAAAAAMAAAADYGRPRSASESYGGSAAGAGGAEQEEDGEAGADRAMDLQLGRFRPKRALRQTPGDGTKKTKHEGRKQQQQQAALADARQRPAKARFSKTLSSDCLVLPLDVSGFAASLGGGGSGSGGGNAAMAGSSRAWGRSSTMPMDRIDEEGHGHGSGNGNSAAAASMTAAAAGAASAAAEPAPSAVLAGMGLGLGLGSGPSAGQILAARRQAQQQPMSAEELIGQLRRAHSTSVIDEMTTPTMTTTAHMQQHCYQPAQAQQQLQQQLLHMQQQQQQLQQQLHIQQQQHMQQQQQQQHVQQQMHVQQQQQQMQQSCLMHERSMQQPGTITDADLASIGFDLLAAPPSSSPTGGSNVFGTQDMEGAAGEAAATHAKAHNDMLLSMQQLDQQQQQQQAAARRTLSMPLPSSLPLLDGPGSPSSFDPSNSLAAVYGHGVFSAQQLSLLDSILHDSFRPMLGPGQ